VRYWDIYIRNWDILRILTVLERSLEERWEELVGSDHELRCARTWRAATRVTRSEPIDMLVFDPAVSGPPTAEDAEQFRALFPSLPAMVYTTLAPGIPSAMLRLGRMGVKRVLLAWLEDQPDRVTNLLLAEAQHTIVAQLNHTVSELLQDGPDKLVWAAEKMLREPASVHTVQHLAETAGMDRRTCARWFEKCNLTTPSIFMILLRVIHGHLLLQDPGYTVDDVAKKLGYSQTRTFAQNVKQFFGMSLREYRTMLSSTEVLAIARQRHFYGLGARLSIVS
jgi:AraC-like DNA-binding protein